MGSLLKLAVCALLASVVLFDVAPRFDGKYRTWREAVRETRDFVRDERHLVQKYPRVMPAFFEDKLRVAAEGVFWPTMLAVWRDSTTVGVLRGVVGWCGANMLVRMLSPESTIEYVGFVAAVGLCAFLLLRYCTLCVMTGSKERLKREKHARRDAREQTADAEQRAGFRAWLAGSTASVAAKLTGPAPIGRWLAESTPGGELRA